MNTNRVQFPVVVYGVADHEWTEPVAVNPVDDAERHRRDTIRQHDAHDVEWMRRYDATDSIAAMTGHATPRDDTNSTSDVVEDGTRQRAAGGDTPPLGGYQVLPDAGGGESGASGRALLPLATRFWTVDLPENQRKGRKC